MQPLFFEDIHPGVQWTSPSRTITESDVSNFAWLTGDFNPLHMDEAFARKTPFRRPIAHGLLGLSFVAGLGSNSPAAHTAAFVRVMDWRFLHPIYFGDTVYVRTEAISKQERGRRRGLVVWKRQLINQDGQIVQEGEFETLVSTRLTEGLHERREKARSTAAPAVESEETVSSAPPLPR